MIAAAELSITILLLVVAFVAFVLAAIPTPGLRRHWHTLAAIGLAAWVLALLLPKL